MTIRSASLRPTALAVSAAAALVLGLLAPAATAAPTPGDPTLASADDWSVVPVAGGFQVTLQLDEPLPLVSDAPTLRVDGVDLGLATESPDGTSLSVLTTDPAVADAGDVTLAWASGDTTKAEPVDAPVTDTATRIKPLATPSQRQLAAAIADGSAVGTYAYRQDDYDYGDQAIDMAGLGGIRGELTGRVYLPVGGGERPTVILLHGRHTSCGTVVAGTQNPGRWPCVPGQTKIPSYKGYDGTAQTLATQGYAVVSISANAINANDAQLSVDNGALARGQLVIDTLKMIEKWNAGTPATYTDAARGGLEVTTEAALDALPAEAGDAYPNRADANQLDAVSLVGRFDLDDVGLMGHSRGGEGVTQAVALNQALPTPYGVRSVLPLAPVDFTRMTVRDTPMLVVLPYCDGDVSNQQGQHFVDDSRYSHADQSFISTVWVMGADHNFFNTSWTPGKYPYSVSDDWSASADEVCGAASPTSIRLSADDQYDVGTELMTAWFRLTLGGDEEFLPLFDGTVDPTLVGTPAADVRAIGQAPSQDRADVERFTDLSSAVRTYGAATAAVCASVNGRTLPQERPFCASTTTTRTTSSMPHWTPASYAPNVPASPMLKLAWTAATGTNAGSVRVTVPRAARDASSYGSMDVKVAPDETVPTGTDLRISVLDADGTTYTSLASALNPLAVRRMPISRSIRNGAPENRLDKIVLQQVSVPVSALAAVPGFDTTDVREVRLEAAVGADATEAGGVYLSDLAFSRSAVGEASSLGGTEPTIDVDATAVEEGTGPDTHDVAVLLDRPATRTTSAWLTVLGSTAATSRGGLVAQQVTFAPGQTCVAVPVPTYGDTVASTTASSVYKISVSNQAEVVYGDEAFGAITVREDDGTVAPAPTTGTPNPVAPAPIPAVGVQGDVCAEAVAQRTPQALTASSTQPSPSQVVTVTGTGYRVGESVTVTDSAAPATPVATVVADATGTVTADVVLLPGATLGTRTITAVGAGSGRTARVELTVVAPGTTAPVTPPVTPTDPTVPVTPGTPGTPPVVSQPVVPPAAAPPVTAAARAASTVATKVTRATRAKVKVRITVAGTTGRPSPTGAVVVRLGKARKTVQVPTSGTRTVTFTKPRGGLGKVKVGYAGDAVYAPSTARKRTGL